MTASTAPSKLLDEAQLADYLGVSRRTTRSWRADGTGPPYVKRGPKWLRYRLEDVDAWLAQHTSKRRVDAELERERLVNAWVQRQLKNAPPLTTDQRDLLRRLLGDQAEGKAPA